MCRQCAVEVIQLRLAGGVNVQGDALVFACAGVALLNGGGVKLRVKSLGQQRQRWDKAIRLKSHDFDRKQTWKFNQRVFA